MNLQLSPSFRLQFVKDGIRIHFEPSRIHHPVQATSEEELDELHSFHSRVVPPFRSAALECARATPNGAEVLASPVVRDRVGDEPGK